jgi:hypothetical protein
MIPSAKSYFVYPDCIDGRKSFNGLTGIIRSELQRDPAGVMYLSLSAAPGKVSSYYSGSMVAL